MAGDGEIPLELDMLNLIDRFGASAVLPSPTPLPLLKRLQAADAVRAAFIERAQSEMDAVWAQQHPGKAHLLNLALRAAIDLHLIEET